ncbi:MAG: Host attachment protein [Zetaproteobacteria bacterium CG1_02_53_45]|nr:MAG: Host attachment protein [Zetaproteobacteria bacterium CG1_02_53_45]
MSIWVVVADSAKARFLTAEKGGEKLTEVHALEHGEGRLREHDMISDRPGRAFDSVGGGRHAMSSQVSPKKQETIKFAKQVADYLEAGRNSNSFDRLYVMAAPEFLGHLRDHFSDSLAQLVIASIDKNFVDGEIDVIQAQLPDFL